MGLTAFKRWVFNQYGKYVWLLSRIGKTVEAFPSEGSELYVITVAYNHVLIEKQIELVKLHVKDRKYLQCSGGQLTQQERTKVH
ncbi:MAG: hypothetical protein K6A98_07970 [Prevotella sp.]|nr:hypothetical protein [Prevotella sp.]